MIKLNFDESYQFRKKSVGLLLRITQKENFEVSQNRTYRKFFSPADVMNLHVSMLDENPSDGVWFSHSQARLNEDIGRLIVFSWKAGQYFVVELFFDRYVQEPEPFVPVIIANGTGRTPNQWRDIPEKCWVHVTGYKVLKLSDIASIRMLRSGDTMDEQIKKNGFRSAEFEI